MKCPTCPDATLVMADRQGVEIDYCPSCRGVWLDRGELDKIIERSAAHSAPPAAAPAAAPMPQHIPQQMPQQVPQQVWVQPHHGYRKHKSWLSDIFD
jgi:Zn-finger nucleic acid-binding protein